MNEDPKPFDPMQEILTNRKRWALKKTMETCARKRKLRKAKNKAKRRQKYGGGK